MKSRQIKLTVISNNHALDNFEPEHGFSLLVETDGITTLFDTGNGAAFVYRDNKGGKMIPMPIVGHWMKKAWGWYCRNSKLGKIPRIPGM